MLPFIKCGKVLRNFKAICYFGFPESFTIPIKVKLETIKFDILQNNPDVIYTIIDWNFFLLYGYTTPQKRCIDA